MSNRRVAVQVDVVPGSGGTGALAPLEGQAKSAADALDKVNQRLNAVMAPTSKAGDPFRNVNTGARELQGRLDRLREPIDRIGRPINDPFQAATRGATTLGQNLGSIRTGAAAAAVALERFGGADSGFGRMMSGLREIEGTLLAIHGMSSLGAGVRGLLGPAVGTAAAAAGGSALATGASGAAGAGVVATQGGNIASGMSSVGGGIRSAAGSTLGRAGILGLGALGVADIARGIGNGGDFRGGFLDVLPDSWASGIAGVMPLRSGGGESSAALQRQQAATMRRNQALMQRERREQQFMQEQSVREPFENAQRDLGRQVALGRVGAEAYQRQVGIQSADTQRQQQLESLQVRADRAANPMASARERQSGQQAEAQIRQQLLQDPGADGAAAAAQFQARANRARVGVEVQSAQREVSRLERDPSALDSQRQQAAERLLQLRQQMAQAIQTEVQAERGVRESTTARLRDNERLLGVMHRQAASRADSHRDQTTGQGRELAGMNALELRNVQNIQRRLAAGEDLNHDETRFAQGVSVLQPQVNQMLDRRVQNSPDIMAIMQSAGRPQEQARLDAAEREAGAAVQNVRGRAEQNAQQAAEQFGQDVEGQVVPALEATGQAIGNALAQAIQRNLAQQVIQAVQQALQQGQAGANAAAGGGAP